MFSRLDKFKAVCPNLSQIHSHVLLTESFQSVSLVSLLGKPFKRYSYFGVWRGWVVSWWISQDWIGQLAVSCKFPKWSSLGGLPSSPIPCLVICNHCISVVFDSCLSLFWALILLDLHFITVYIALRSAQPERRNSDYCGWRYI
ncbi:hypothetical protein PISMIDRAFT_689171 [Pisolithus microcarpus 441]|uniref:Uncharacterized protein n=1 Tax=Pisolithus microcarpus 441 TaxID=765257 RepID=A0A0C9YFT6_9AGAM|nr:hypothetical protein BKA83DRAFT_689171 [Pisolithus microcarpus]KIK12804.1 hypothetical protein PISMIDRAFT_689171 [Pisolithus microcarpus 441]